MTHAREGFPRASVRLRGRQKGGSIAPDQQRASRERDRASRQLLTRLTLLTTFGFSPEGLQ